MVEIRFALPMMDSRFLVTPFDDAHPPTGTGLVTAFFKKRPMALLEVLKSNLRRSVLLYEALIARIPESALSERLPGIRSNTIGQQLWCVVGARESYSRAIAAGEWKGFSCSVTREQCSAKGDLAKSLDLSGARLLEVVSTEKSFTDSQHQLILDALEHEAAHQGQLIRYLYALNLPIPEIWKTRFALD